MRAYLIDLSGAVEAMHTAENYIRQNPLRAVAIAAGLGFLYG